MRTPIIAGNWKLHMNPDQTVEFVKAVKDNLPATDKVEALICAPSVDLDALARTAQGSNLRIGAENAYFENEGAFTGETSPKVLKDMGMNYCIIGHSERRGYFHETDEDINKKAKSLFAEGITPVICCGESLEKREANQQEKWVIGQIKAALQGLSAEQVSKTVIAYEPIWAIGTGKTATSDQAEDMCKTIRDTVRNLYNEETAENVRIQYGGSVNPDNVRELMAKPDIDGGLVGGASLKPDSFLALVNYQD